MSLYLLTDWAMSADTGTADTLSSKSDNYNRLINQGHELELMSLPNFVLAGSGVIYAYIVQAFPV
jgi:hypothetical protein